MRKSEVSHKRAIERMAGELLLLAVVGGTFCGIAFSIYICIAIIVSGIFFSILLMALAQIAGAIEESKSKIYDKMENDTVSVKGQKD